MIKREALDLKELNGKLGRVILQADHPDGIVEKTIEFGTINIGRNVVQKVLGGDEELGGPYNVRVVEFREISIIEQKTNLANSKKRNQGCAFLFI